VTPEQIFEKSIATHFPAGIFHPIENSPNFLICKWLDNSVATFFNHNTEYLKIAKPHFYLIHSDSINGCAFDNKGYNFIGITKGLIDYSSFTFRNILRDNNFLPEALEKNENQQAVIINNEDFTGWRTFCQNNNLSFDALDYTPNNSDRRIIGEALSQYFIFFSLLHEVGHLRQRNPNYLLELDTLTNRTKKDYQLHQVLEMDADKFAVNQLANHLITAFKNRELPINQPYMPFFKNQSLVVRYSIFMLFFMFYFFSHNNNFAKYFFDYPHPHPALRFSYSSRLLIECFYDNSFMSKDELLQCYKLSISDFGNLVQRIYPHAEWKKFFELIKDTDLDNHYHSLKATALGINNLNGDYSL